MKELKQRNGLLSRSPALGAVWCFASALLLGGCSALQPVVPETVNNYALEAQFEPVAEGHGSLTLLVSTPRARAGFDSRHMIYIKKPHELAYFSRNQWVDSPSRMLAPLLVQALESRGLYHAVVQVPSVAAADVRLDTEIIRLQQEFLTIPSKAHFTLRAQLISLSGNQVLATQEFDIYEDAPSDDPYGGVIAINRAVKKMLSRLADFCASKSTGITPPGATSNSRR